MLQFEKLKEACTQECLEGQKEEENGTEKQTQNQ